MLNMKKSIKENIQIQQAAIAHNNILLEEANNYINSFSPKGFFATILAAIVGIAAFIGLISLSILMAPSFSNDSAKIFFIVIFIVSLIISGKIADKVRYDLSDTLEVEHNIAMKNKAIEAISKAEDRIRILEQQAVKKALEESPLNFHAKEVGSVEGIGERSLYYLKVKKNGKTYYKIGITKNSVASRYSREYEKYEVLYEKIHSKAETLEDRIKYYYGSYIDGEKILGTQGTEVFCEDVLKLDIGH